MNATMLNPTITAILDTVIKSSVVLILTLAAARMLHRRSASLRHLVWTAGLVSALLLPLLGFVLPVWQPRVAEVREVRPLAATIPLPAVPTTSVTAAAAKPELPAAPARVAPWLLFRMLWLAGVLVVATLLFIEMIKLARVALRSEAVRQQSWRTLVFEVSRQLQLKRRVRLLRNPNASVLGTWGALRPRVLLPRESENWSAERMRVVLGHELAHVKRNDWLVQIVAETARAIYWFNPLFWLACSALRRESEHACDDSALRLGADGPTYAAHVLDLVRTLKHSGRPGTAALAMAGTSNLERRVVAMLNPGLNRGVATRSTVAIVVLLAGCLTLPLATIQLSARPPVIEVSKKTETVAQTPLPTAARPEQTTAPTPIRPPSTDYQIQPNAVIVTARDGSAAAEPKTEPVTQIAQASIGGTFIQANPATNNFINIVGPTPTTTQNVGAIDGAVHDATMARIRGVTVTATDLSSGEVRVTLTNESGLFSFPQLPAGNYAMTTALRGFKTSVLSSVEVGAGRSVQINVTLQIDVASTVVEVTASRSGPVCISSFGSVKADGTPFTKEDCPNGTPVYGGAARTAPQPSTVVTAPLNSTTFVVTPMAPSAVPATGRKPPLRIGGDIQKGKLVSILRPLYPAAARSQGVEGVVILSGIIKTDGSLQSLNVISSTDPVLNDAALDAIQRWVYTPTLLNSAPVESMTTITVNYTLNR